MCLPAGIYMHKNPRIYFSWSSMPYKEVARISPPFVPHEVPQECNGSKKTLPNFRCKSEIWNPLHETSKRPANLCLVDLTNPRNNFTKWSQMKDLKSSFWIHVEPALTKKDVFLPWCQKCEDISHQKLPIYITKQSLMNQLQPLSNSYPLSNVAWTTKLFSSKKPRWYDFQIWTQLLSIAI